MFIPGPGVKKAPDPGSATLGQAYCAVKDDDALPVELEAE